MFIIAVAEYGFRESALEQLYITIHYSITFIHSEHRYVFVQWHFTGWPQCLKAMVQTLMIVTTETFIQFHFHSLAQSLALQQTVFLEIKGTVHPNMKVLSLLLIQTSAEHKEEFWIWRMSVTKQLMDPIDFHSIFFKIYYFMFSRRRKIIHVWNNL